MKLTVILSLLITALISTAPASAQWQKIAVDTTAGLRGLSVVSQNVIWASGTGGTFLKSTDGGQTWLVGKVPGAEKLDFRDIEAFDAKTAYLLSIGNGESSRIYKTTDGGQTWNLQFKNGDERAFFDALAFWDRNNGYAMSDPVEGRFVLIKTSDGGANWTPVGAFSAAQGEAAFAASGTCLITNGKNGAFLVSGGNAANVFRTTDRGKIWIAADTPMARGTPGSGIFSIAMRDAKNGIVVGGNYEKPAESAGNLAFTADGGRTWTAGSGLNGYRSGVSYIDKNTIIAVGSSGSDISTDGGKTWRNIDALSYNAVQAKGKNAVWAVGDKGMVARYALK